MFNVILTQGKFIQRDTLLCNFGNLMFRKLELIIFKYIHHNVKPILKFKDLKLLGNSTFDDKTLVYILLIVIHLESDLLQKSELFIKITKTRSEKVLHKKFVKMIDCIMHIYYI